MICIKCKTNIPDTAKFCPKCGAKVEMAMTQDIILCPKCRTSYPFTAKFCRKDGTPLQKVSPSVTEIKKPEVTEKEIKPEAIVEHKLEVPMEVKTEEKPPKPEAVMEPEVSIEEKPSEKKPEPEKPKDVIICPKCGTPNSLTAKFCKKDGTPLKGEIKPETVIERKPKEVTPAKARKAPIWIAVPFLVVILGGAGGYLVYQYLKPKEASITPEAPKTAEPAGVPEKIVTPPEEEKPAVDTHVLEGKLNLALRERGLSDVSAEVNEDLVATLRGTVNDPRDKMLASNVLKSFKELKEVKNEILVAKKSLAPAPERPAEAPAPVSPPGYKIDPAKLEGDINRALRNAGLRSVTAEVNDNLEVTLKGSVGSNYEKDRAFEIAKRFKEAKRIRDVIFVIEQ